MKRDYILYEIYDISLLKLLLNYGLNPKISNNNRSFLEKIITDYDNEMHQLSSMGIDDDSNSMIYKILKEFNDYYKDFAKTIAEWTIKNMQSPRGYFYYRKNKIITNKVSYMRWSQAWMMLALTELFVNDN